MRIVVGWLRSEKIYWQPWPLYIYIYIFFFFVPERQSANWFEDWIHETLFISPLPIMLFNTAKSFLNLLSSTIFFLFQTIRQATFNIIYFWAATPRKLWQNVPYIHCSLYTFERCQGRLYHWPVFIISSRIWMMKNLTFIADHTKFYWFKLQRMDLVRKVQILDESSCLNFWDEAWWFLSFRVFRLFSSSLLLYSLCFSLCVLWPSSGVSCKTWKPT